MAMNHDDQPGSEDTGDDGIGPLVERWIERTQQRLKARPRWAPLEPTGLRAAGEAMAMAGYLLANAGVTRPERRS